MSLLGFMFRKKKEPKLGYWVLIAFSEEAKDKAVGNDFLKKIYHINGKYAFKVENYSSVKEKHLRKNGVIMVDRTVGQLIPKEARNIPEAKELLTRLQITKVIGD